jgi:glyoxylase-like metal-dependent hydrolase (beta-lactamase superfamily II)
VGAAGAGRRAEPIRLGLRPLVVRGEQTLIIDGGCGDKMDAKSADIYGLDLTPGLTRSLAEAGLSSDDIDIALASHLHFDHVGGFTVRDEDGRSCRVSRARGTWRARPSGRTPPIRTSGTARATWPRTSCRCRTPACSTWSRATPTIMPGVRVVRTGGHTMHHQIVYIESGGRTAVFTADLMPTTAHVDEPWIMAYDLYPMDTLAFKRTFVREAIDREYLIFFEHDPDIAAGYIREKGGRKHVEAVM